MIGKTISRVDVETGRLHLRNLQDDPRWGVSVRVPPGSWGSRKLPERRRQELTGVACPAGSHHNCGNLVPMAVSV